MSTRNASDTRGLTWYNILAVSCFSMGAIFWGYDIGILSTVLVAPGYLTALKNPSSGESGLIVAIFSVGSWLSYAFVAGPVNDRLGRRWSGVTGVAVLCVGAGLQAGAVHLAMMVIGRFIAGVGTGIVATAVPLYLSETSPARHRGAIITLNQVGISLGISIAFWIGYGFSFWRAGNGESLGWRLSILIQYVPAVIFCVGAPFLCESPRWLLEHDQLEAAAKALTDLRGSDRPEFVQAELEEIRASILWHKENSISDAKVFIKDRALWARLWRAWALQFLQQLSGAGGIRYYLPSNFRGAGASESLSLLASGIDGTVMAACTIAAILLVDRIGRRHSLGIGAAIMALSMLMNGALQTRYPNQSNVAANNCSIFFIFFFSLGYSIGFGPTAWTYAAEIFPAHVRARGLGIAASGASLGGIIVGQVWPVAVAGIGARTYFVFTAINVLSVVLVYTMYPETKGLTLEEIDSHFGKSNFHSETEATPKVMLGDRVEQVEINGSRKA
ncbi:general substrate transporter [Dactylonectria estremocensis]|uniref:General substrate transporter n=1 Tax=Dactylonectria estremocensis TaxID=1079267 RepID=A0A9P9D4I0_9HYPO|nr:general substrate transporter [Dactylonectria estremocensis]